MNGSLLSLIGLVALAALQTGCIAFGAPPARVEVGSAVLARDGAANRGLRVSAGAHYASGTISR
ncbi:MAG: hypothetical protein AAGC55_28760, partial [Myxococcota bacterium]